MNQSIRRVFLCLFVAAFLLAPGNVEAQTYELFATQSELTPEDGDADAHCIVELSTGTLAFFNSSEGGIYTWDGSNLQVHTSPSDLNDNISGENNPINRCDAVAKDGNDNIFFSFRNSDSGVNFIYRTSAGDASDFAVKEIDGINGLAILDATIVIGDATLYLANVARFDDTDTREDGIYSISADLSGDPQAVATNADVALEDAIAIGDDETIYGYSTGSGDFENMIVSVDPNDSSPSFESFVDPYGDGTLTTGNSSIPDLEVVTHNGEEFIVVFNNSFSGPNGEEFGSIRVSDQSIALLFTESDLVDNLAVSEYTSGFTEPMFVNSSGEVFITSRDAFGASDYIAQVSNPAPLPVELAAFDVTTDGSNAMLSWTTASETNNAGFAVQHRAPGATSFANLGFVEGAGTTNQSQSYRFRAEALSPGTHTFRLKQVDVDGSTELGPERSVTIRTSQGLTIAAPNPLPAGQSAQLTLQVDAPQTVTVALYNVLGQRVRTLHTGTATPAQPVEARLKTDGLPSGLYFVRATGSSVNTTKRLTIVK